MRVYGSTFFLLDGVQDSSENLTSVFAECVSIAALQGWRVANAAHWLDPINVEAYKTISFEICDYMGQKPVDAVYLPVGGGGLFSGSWNGYREYLSLSRISRMPKMVAVQPFGAASIAAGLAECANDAIPVQVTSMYRE